MFIVCALTARCQNRFGQKLVCVCVWVLSFGRSLTRFWMPASCFRSRACHDLFSGWRARLFFNYYYYHEFCFPGGVRGYFLIATTITSYVVFEWCARLFFVLLRLRILLLFRVVCVVMFNYYCDCEFCFSRVACTVILDYYYYHEFCVFGWRARLLLNYYYYRTFVFFRVACTVIFKLLYLLRVLFLGVACTVIFTYYYYH